MSGFLTRNLTLLAEEETTSYSPLDMGWTEFLGLSALALGMLAFLGYTIYRSWPRETPEQKRLRELREN